VSSPGAVGEKPPKSEDIQSQHSIIATFDTHQQAESAVKELAPGRADDVAVARRILERTAATETELFKPN
jgi:hypothetical protein